MSDLSSCFAASGDYDSCCCFVVAVAATSFFERVAPPPGTRGPAAPEHVTAAETPTNP